jgi:hypothetical protein
MIIAVGLLALCIGFGLWWIYFDLVAAVAALVVGWVRPAPWLLALLLVAVLSVLWAFAVLRFVSADAWGEAPAAVD